MSLGVFGNYVLERDGFFHAATVFYMPVPSSGTGKERFEWKTSSGQEVAALDGRNKGLKCVRCSTGQVVAAFTNVRMSKKKVGKMAFLGEKLNLGEAAEMMIFVSLCAVIEKARRGQRSSAAAAGGAGGGGAC